MLLGWQSSKYDCFGQLKQLIIDTSVKGNHWGHYGDHLASEATWGHFEATEAISRPLKLFRDHLGHSDVYFTSEVTWGCFEAI